MKIISKFKDFYDAVSHKYGADPGVVYVRAPIAVGDVDWKPLKREWSERTEGAEFEDTLERALDKIYKQKPRINVAQKNSGLELKFVVAGPHVVAFVGSDSLPHSKWARLDERQEWRLKETPRYERHRRVRIEGEDQYDRVWPRLPSPERLEKLIKLVGAPVFTVRRRNWSRSNTLTIDGRVPVLADLGFGALVSPEQMWQDIYATLTNVLRANPDKAPPVEVAEKIRIEYAGFDLRTSFRHPILPKQKKSKKMTK